MDNNGQSLTVMNEYNYANRYCTWIQ